MNEMVINAILSYGERYREEMLCQQYTKEQLREDWWEALKFFFGRAFFQGRRNDVSERVYNAAVEVLEAERPVLDRCFEENNWGPLREKLEEKIGKGKIGKAGDVRMTIDTLEYVSMLPDRNIVGQSVERINGGDTDRHYRELQNIFQVGPKIAAVYLRDVVSLFQLEDRVPNGAQFCLQAIDVWVRKLAVKTDIVTDGATDEQIRQAIVKLCQEQRCSPLQFNQGAWYAGYFAFDLLLENLAAHGL